MARNNKEKNTVINTLRGIIAFPNHHRFPSVILSVFDFFFRCFGKPLGLCRVGPEMNMLFVLTSPQVQFSCYGAAAVCLPLGTNPLFHIRSLAGVANSFPNNEANWKCLSARSSRLSSAMICRRSFELFSEGIKPI